ncbi:hypothetical protein F4678DRAFT_57253 [Xylaria arbuscula]|nr:hypothetical protein F4678DRAFT_57253 [Xylaria arbuscula]
MDPFSAIGFASNILSFVDFSWNLITEAQEIYESTSGITSNDRTIEIIAQDVQGLCAAMIARSPAGSSDLQELAQECQGIANELLTTLKKLTLPKQIPERLKKCGSFVLALRRVMKKGNLDSISVRLQKLQLQLLMRLQWMLQSESSEIATSIAKIENSIFEMGVEKATSLRELRAEIVETLGRLEIDATARRMVTPEKPPYERKDICGVDFHQVSIAIKELSTRMYNLEKNCQEAKTLSQLLENLYFDDIWARRHRIDEAHAKTFQWVLIPDTESGLSQTKFVDWLRGDRSVFWVRGKPGSGKSVLMKYLSQHPNILEHLAIWSGTDQLVIARYFFWNSGMPLEKSQEGLLRSLLFDILRSLPELASTIQKAKNGYGTPVPFTDRWSRQELLKILELVSQIHLPVKFCLFIDGLDEYKGDTSELLGLIQKLASTPSIKLCVSGRPWTEFVDAFGGEENFVLKLEDLTRRDIRFYVDDSLHSNQRFVALAKDETAYIDLADEVVSKAQGVFLWVKLAIRSLLQGATYADNLSDMRKRVEELPDDLDAFYEAILADVPSRYLQKTALTARVMLATDRPLHLGLLYFIDDIISDPDFAVKAPIRTLSKTDSRNIGNQVAARLDGRFKGLLEIGIPGWEQRECFRKPIAFHGVHFIHRTARDFLQMKFVTTQDTSSMSNACSILCHAALALLKCCPGTYKQITIQNFVASARKIEDSTVLSLKLNEAVRQIEEIEAEHRMYLLDASLDFGWLWYVKQRITKANSSEDLRSMVAQTCNMITGKNRIIGYTYWTMYLEDQDTPMNKELMQALGQCFARCFAQDFDSFHTFFGDDLLLKYMSCGLPLSFVVDKNGQTIRDHIAKRAALDNPNGPVFLWFLNNPDRLALRQLIQERETIVRTADSDSDSTSDSD